MLAEFGADLGGWTWWIIAAVLAILELVVSGVFFIWLAGAAAIVALLLLVVDIPLLAQIVLFAALSVAAVWFSRRFLSKHPMQSDRPLLNQRAKAHIGQVHVLDQAILNGRGKLKIGDTLWLAQGPDMEAGTPVRIIGDTDGIFDVERA